MEKSDYFLIYSDVRKFKIGQKSAGPMLDLFKPDLGPFEYNLPILRIYSLSEFLSSILLPSQPISRIICKPFSKKHTEKNHYARL